VISIISNFQVMHALEIHEALEVRAIVSFLLDIAASEVQCMLAPASEIISASCEYF